MAIGSLGAVAYDIVANDKTATGTASSSERFKQVSLAAGAAMTAAGAAIVGLTDQSKKTNAALGVTGLQIGATKEEMRDLALETTNVTFPLEEVQKSFDLLARAGMRDKEAIAATATAFDTLGDAINMPASQVTDTLIPAFNAFDIPLEDAAAHTDAFTHLVRNTTIDLGDFSTTMNYLAPDIDTLGISLGDTVAIMEALADRGIQGSAATKEFRKAVTAADGDVSLLYESLGLTEAEVAAYASEVEGAEGMTQAFADAANEQYGMVDNLKQTWDEWSLSIGSALEPLDAVGGVMTAMGPVMMGLPTIMSTLSAVQSGTLVPSLYATATAGWAAIAPWAPFILAGALVVGALWLLEEHFGLVSWAIDSLVGIGQGLISWVTGALSGGLEEGGDSLLLFLGPIGAVVWAFQHWDEILPAIQAVFAGVIDYITGLFDWFAEAGSNIVGMIVDGILNSPVTPWGAMKTVLGAVGDLLPHSPAKEGPLSELPNWDAYLVDPLTDAGTRIPGALAGNLEAAAQPLAAATSSTTHIGGDTLSIGNINVRSERDLDEIFRRWEEMQRSKRVQRGVRA
jgi:hypothetical protein